MNDQNKFREKSIIGISLGDLKGVGPEVILKALSDQRILKHSGIIVYGSAKILSFYRKNLNIDINYTQIKNAEQVNPKKVCVLNVWDEAVEINPGKVTDVAGSCAFKALKKACEDLRDGYINGLVTAPINKKNIQSDEFQSAGHTEFLTQFFEAKQSLMMMVANKLRVAVATEHIPLRAVSDEITKDKLKNKIGIFLKSLKKDFGIRKPRIAIMALNPHGGEEGLIGNEEREIITPVLEEFKNDGHLLFGPFPADGFFGTVKYQKYDGILAMYHDQGLIPFKTLAFESGVNFTAGLPVVRTSPDHGTGYDIAGKNIADPGSLREALFLAHDIIMLKKDKKIALT